MKKRRVVAKADRTFMGVTYRSGFEAAMARDHHERGVAVEYEAETLWYTTPHFSRVDWRITTASGKKILVESKGWFPPEDRLKVQRLVECNPDVDYRLVFQSANPKFVAWAKKHRIKYAIGKIPDAWFRE